MSDEDEPGLTFAQMRACSKCDWSGMVEEGEWECPKCETSWQDVSVSVPSDMVGDLLEVLNTHFTPLLKARLDSGGEEE